MERVQAEQIAMSQLDGGERLLWSGTPAAGAAARRALPAVLFGIPFTAFAAFWIVMASGLTKGVPKTAGPWMLFPLFGIPFLLVGLGVMLGPLWVYLAARKTVYAVTEKRALIIVGGAVQSFTSADVGDISRFERSDGSGSVFFASRGIVTSNGFTRQARVGFEGIPDVRQVEKLIRDQLAQKAAA
jgi:hypothetical protein